MKSFTYTVRLQMNSGREITESQETLALAVFEKIVREFNLDRANVQLQVTSVEKQ